ncbi:phasin family protein [Georhizobium sp. MAB10]|jgi:hypothetical protein|uniref:phasin family protein n=1 Tax=Georhizobium sp. MAB10 TaxID=3028319 RepID=UPI0038558192
MSNASIGLPKHSKTSAAELPPFMIGTQKFAVTAMRLQAQALKASVRYQIELLSFFKHRCEKDLKLVDDLVESDELTEAFDVMSAFLQGAADEYATEASRFATLGSKLAADTAKRVRKETDGAAEDFAARTIS